MLRHRLLIVTAVLTLLFAGTCVLYAQPAPNAQEGDFFSKLDTNQDGKIDRTEFRGSDEAFARMDKNADGCIARDELAAQAGAGQRGLGQRAGGQGQRQMDPAARWARMLERFDADKNGEISTEEFQGPEQVMTFLDANKDGTITEEEAMQAANRGVRREGQAQAVDPAERWQQILQNHDADKNGKLSQEEWPGRTEKFTELDRDGDGFIIQEEMPAPPGGAAGAEGRQRQDPAQIIIRLMDSDEDGQVSQEEWANFFDGTDVNEDEAIGRDELMAKLQELLRPRPREIEAEEPAAPAEGF